MAWLSLLLLYCLFSPILSTDVCQKNPTIYRFEHGNIRGTIVSDGPLFLTLDTFAVETEAVRRSYKSAFRVATPLQVSQNVAVLDVPKVGRVIVDSGSFGIQESFDFAKSAGRLQENLKAAGIPKESIDAIFITHGHLDHIAGVNDVDGSRAFPNAKLYIGEKEHQYWLNPTPNVNGLLANDSLPVFSEIYKQAIAPYQSKPGRLVPVPTDGNPFPGVRFTFGPGHSPGHNAIEFSSGGKRLVVSGDTWITRPDQVQNPEWAFDSESDISDAYRSRIKLLTRVSKRKDLVLSYHEQFPGLGFVSRGSHLFDWVPAAPQELEIGVTTHC